MRCSRASSGGHKISLWHTWLCKYGTLNQTCSLLTRATRAFNVSWQLSNIGITITEPLLSFQKYTQYVYEVTRKHLTALSRCHEWCYTLHSDPLHLRHCLLDLLCLIMARQPSNRVKHLMASSPDGSTSKYRVKASAASSYRSRAYRTRPSSRKSGG